MYRHASIVRLVIIIYLLILTSTAGAQKLLATPEEIVFECKSQMQLGICRVRPTQSKSSAGQTVLISGMGRVSLSAYMDFMNLYDESSPNNTAMCDMALNYLKKDPNGDHALIARSMWTPTQDKLLEMRHKKR